MTALAWAGRARKFITALGGAASEAISLGLLSGSAEHYVTAGLAVVTAFLVYFVPNDTPAGATDQPAPAAPSNFGPSPQPGAPFSGGH